MSKRLMAGRRSVLAGLMAVLSGVWAGGLRQLRPARAAGAVVGKVAKLRGDAFLQRDGARAPLEVDAELRTDDLVMTMADSRVKLAFVDGSSVTLSEFTKMTLDQYAVDANAGTRDAGLTLQTGVLRALVAKSGVGSRFEVASGNAVAAARSTDWIVEADGARTQVYVIEGAVDVADRGATSRSLPSIADEDRLLLKPGRVARFNGGKVLSAAWDQVKVNDLMAQTTF